MWAESPDLGSLALDFLHTLRRTRRGVVDLVRTPETLTAWLVTHAGERAASRLRDPVPPSEGRLLLDEAQRLRRDIGVLVSSYAGSGALDDAAAYGVNRVLSAWPRSWMLMTEAGRVVVSERELAQGGRLGALTGIAEAAARLVSTFEPARIRRCASDVCGAWFLDTSKAGRRRWCSMALCGNRAKASVHRSRLRSE